MQIQRLVRGVPPLLLLVSSPSMALAAADTAGPILDLRYRYEHVDQQGMARDAHAHTLRARVGYRTGTRDGWSALAEVDGVGRLGGEHNDTRNGLRQYPVVPDPPGTEVNQALVRHAGDRHAFTAGRQRINLGNQRFVGGSAWRQNEQTYDGVRVQFSPTAAISVDYTWLEGINTIFGPHDSAATSRANLSDIEGHGQLLQAGWKVSQALALTGYHHRIELEGAAVTATAPPGTLSSRTTGVRLAGKQGAWSYAAEYARQRDLDPNPWHLDSRYWLAEVGYALRGATVRVGYESLGGGEGAGNRAFQTPLGTKHLFQGWADVFATTPAQGVDDAYAGAVVPLAGGSLQAWYHDFSPQHGGGSYGQEIDLAYAHPIPGVKGLGAMVKLARYRSDDAVRTADTDKLWVQVQYAY